MRVNVYAEEITDRVEIVTKKTEEGEFTGVRFYLELPVTVYSNETITKNVSGPFIHRPYATPIDDDSAAVTFWGKKDLEKVLRKALELLEAHHAKV